MANRAYLFSIDGNDVNNWRCPDEYYYDSRWNIPAAWFFFFKVDDVKVVELVEEVNELIWSEIRLIADKQQAIKLFIDRFGILNSLSNHQIQPESIREFLVNVNDWSGDYLVIDPVEIFDDMPQDEAWHVNDIANLLAIIDSSKNISQKTELIERLQVYTDLSVTDPEELLFNLIGTTYW